MAYVGQAPKTGAYQILDDISGSFTGSTPGPFNNGQWDCYISRKRTKLLISISGVCKIQRLYYFGKSDYVYLKPCKFRYFFGTVLGNTFDIGTPTDATVTAGSLATTFS